jgi:hypothetical protein
MARQPPQEISHARLSKTDMKKYAATMDCGGAKESMSAFGQ